MNKVDQIFAQAEGPAEFATGYLKYLSELVLKMDSRQIGRFIEALEKTRTSHKKTIFLGNGGSAATASHFANDIVAGPRAWENPYRAISLSDNMALLTAIGNDHGYDKIFELQLKVHLEPGDVVVAISASGNSPNVLSAIRYANSRGATTVGLTGFDGGELMKLVHIPIHVPTAKGEYGPVEDLHMVVDHLVSGYLIQVNRQLQLVNKTGT